MRSVGGETLRVFTVEARFRHFVSQTKKSRSAAVPTRHAQTIRELMAILGPRAKLNIAVVTSRDVAELRDDRDSLGPALATVNINVAILFAAFNAELRAGHISGTRSGDTGTPLRRGEPILSLHYQFHSIGHFEIYSRDVFCFLACSTFGCVFRNRRYSDVCGFADSQQND